MLFRCEGCAFAFCEDHLPEEADVVMESERFARLGYRRTAAACYVRCSAGCAHLADALRSERPLRSPSARSPAAARPGQAAFLSAAAAPGKSPAGRGSGKSPAAARGSRG